MEKTKESWGGGRICLRTPFKLSNGPPDWASFYHLTIDTTLIISGKTYTDVQKIQMSQDASYPYLLDEDPSNGNFYMYVYHAKGFGIIKYEEPRENKSIELIKSNIVQ